MRVTQHSFDVAVLTPVFVALWAFFTLTNIEVIKTFFSILAYINLTIHSMILLCSIGIIISYSKEFVRTMTSNKVSILATYIGNGLMCGGSFFVLLGYPEFFGIGEFGFNFISSMACIAIMFYIVSTFLVIIPRMKMK